MLKDLCTNIGISGYETQIVKFIYNELESKCDDIYIDAIGNLICKINGKTNTAKKILFSAHIDEVGLQISSKIDDGTYKFKVLGNIECNNLIYQRVVVGVNKEVGLIISDFSDVGKYEHSKLKLRLINRNAEIQIGDIGTFQPNYISGEEYICSKSLDNRVGVYILSELIKKGLDSKEEFVFAFTTQEEIGLKGIQVVLPNIAPDIHVCVDVSPINEASNLVINNGVAIKVSDGLSISNIELVKSFEEVAKKNNVKYQLEVSESGASEMMLVSGALSAYKTIGISVPVENIHTANSIVCISDIEDSIQLLRSYIYS